MHRTQIGLSQLYILASNSAFNEHIILGVSFLMAIFEKLTHPFPDIAAQGKRYLNGILVTRLCRLFGIRVVHARLMLAALLGAFVFLVVLALMPLQDASSFVGRVWIGVLCAIFILGVTVFIAFNMQQKAFGRYASSLTLEAREAMAHELVGFSHSFDSSEALTAEDRNRIAKNELSEKTVLHECQVFHESFISECESRAFQLVSETATKSRAIQLVSSTATKNTSALWFIVSIGEGSLQSDLDKLKAKADQIPDRITSLIAEQRVQQTIESLSATKQEAAE